MSDDLGVISCRHENYAARYHDWCKWRAVYEGGECFIEEYVKRWSKRESTSDFSLRKEFTPVAAFAQAAVNELILAIASRLPAIKRVGGPANYLAAVNGQGGGVDRRGRTMETFLAECVLPELLPMAAVGIYVDQPALTSPDAVTLRDEDTLTPYLYTYRIEDILDIDYWDTAPWRVRAVLLRERAPKYNRYGLHDKPWDRYRHIYQLEDGRVFVDVYNGDGFPVTMTGSPVAGGEYRPSASSILLNISRIPFVVADIGYSLLTNVANHQIALTSLESSDVSYALKANFAFFVAQQSATAGWAWDTSEAGDDGSLGDAHTSNPNSREITAGGSQGYQYPAGANEPAFIHPSPDPLRVSMEKQAQLKIDIQALIRLSLTALKPQQYASADLVRERQQGQEAGIACIAGELFRVDRDIAQIWAEYMGGQPATIAYPTRWAVQTEADRLAEIEKMEEVRDSVPSPTFQREMSKQIAEKWLFSAPDEMLETIANEIDSAKCFTANPEILFEAVDRAVLSLEIAAELLGIPPESVEQAKQDHADRLKVIADTQADAQGQPAENGEQNGGGDGGDGGFGRKETADQPTGADRSRGEGA